MTTKKTDLSTLTDADLEAEVQRRAKAKKEAEALAARTAKEAEEAKRQDALVKIEVEVQSAYAALNRAEAIAKEAGVSFYFSPSYGMGGSYDPDDGCWSSSSSNC